MLAVAENPSPHLPSSTSHGGPAGGHMSNCNPATIPMPNGTGRPSIVKAVKRIFRSNSRTVSTTSVEDRMPCMPTEASDDIALPRQLNSRKSTGGFLRRNQSKMSGGSGMASASAVDVRYPASDSPAGPLQVSALHIHSPSIKDNMTEHVYKPSERPAILISLCFQTIPTEIHDRSFANQIHRLNAPMDIQQPSFRTVHGIYKTSTS